MFCKNCGKEIEEGANYCPICGDPLNVDFREHSKNSINYVSQSKKVEPKSQFVAIVFCLLFGIIGLHDFYLEQNGYGITKLVILILLGWIGVGFAINIFLCVCDFSAIILKTKPYNKVLQ